MQITIDGSEIDFTLENEKSIADVVGGVENWLAANNSMIRELKVDGDAFDPADRSALKERVPDQVSGLEVVTAPLSDIEVENAVEVLIYLNKYRAGIADQDPQIVSDEGFEGLHWILTSVRLAAGLNMINLLTFPEAENSLFNLFVRLETSMLKLKELDPEGRLPLFLRETAPLIDTLLPAVKDFYLLISRRKERDFDPIERADKCGEEIASLMERIGQLSIDLQTGNELKAMQAIQEITLYLENLFTFVSVVESKHGVDIASICSGGVALTGWIQRLSGIGTEVIEAFDNKDTVLLGDLFEYEIGEELEKAPAFIGAIKAALDG